MTRTVHLVFVGACLAILGCGKKGGAKDSEETVKRLATLERDLAANNTALQLMRDENARLQLEPAGCDEWLFTLEGDLLEIKGKPGKGGGGGGGGGSIDEATATAMYEQFMGLVNKSRGPLQKCYEGALKKSPNLQGKSVTLTLKATFAASGTFSKVSFSPELPTAFDSCLRGITGKWKLPAQKAEMVFQANVKLTPT